MWYNEYNYATNGGFVMQLWTPTHAAQLLPCLAVMLVLAVLLRLWLGKKPLSVRIIPFQILAVIIVLLEIGKQIVSAADGQYDLYHIPLHFCSLFIFTMPAMAFWRGKGAEKVRGITAAFCTSMALLLLIYPVLIYGDWNINNFFVNYLDFHTVAFHNVVLFAFILLLALRLHPVSVKGELKATLWFTAGFCVVSSVMAQILKTNYANYYSCNIPPLEAVRVSLQGVLGYVPTQILYILIVSALNIGFVYGSYWFFRLVRRLLEGKAKDGVDIGNSEKEITV